ncbi:MAG: osmotically inducible protein C [Ignavibacteria bacterium]|nr:osmotically inducible protein C [Ignavibacteria bacterium]
MNMEIYFEGKKKVIANYNGLIINTDQPLKSGGDGSAPAPFDLFLASIGTCAGIYIKSFCDKRNIPTDDIRIIQSMNYNSNLGLIDKIDLEIKLPADFPEKYKDALINAADLCAVKKHLKNPPEINVTTLVAPN